MVAYATHLFAPLREKEALRFDFDELELRKTVCGPSILKYDMIIILSFSYFVIIIQCIKQSKSTVWEGINMLGVEIQKFKL